MAKLNKGHYHELADRLHVSQNNLEDNIGNHPVMTKKKKWKKKFNKAQAILGELYQKAGAKM